MFTDKGLKKGLLDLPSINEFLKKPASKWSSCKTYKHDKEAIKLLPVVNDPAEKYLEWQLKCMDKKAQSKKHCLAQYKVVHSIRRIHSSIGTSSVHVTKNNHNNFLNWSQL